MTSQNDNLFKITLVVYKINFFDILTIFVVLSHLKKEQTYDVFEVKQACITSLSERHQKLWEISCNKTNCKNNKADLPEKQLQKYQITDLTINNLSQLSDIFVLKVFRECMIKQ